MKVFISYKYTGETKEDLNMLLVSALSGFNKNNLDVYCNFFDTDLPIRSKDFKPQDYVFDSFKFLSDSDLLFVILNSEVKSEGMILEVGYAIAKNIPVVITKITIATIIIVGTSLRIL